MNPHLVECEKSIYRVEIFISIRIFLCLNERVHEQIYRTNHNFPFNLTALIHNNGQIKVKCTLQTFILKTRKKHEINDDRKKC